MKLEQFEMERMQSTWENLVDYNLSESGVHPVRISELIPQAEDRERLLGMELGYSQSNGTLGLRASVADLYEGATAENVIVTTGTAEANLLVSWMMTEPGDEIIMMVPNYMQLWGLFKSFGADLKPLPLVEDGGWRIDLDQLESAISAKTKLIAVCNPNNPTGAVMSSEEMDRIVAAAERVGAWILADEVYRGAEMKDEMTKSFWGRYERVIVTSGLSKAYGLPGLRIGWIASTPEIAARAWAYHDYTTIGPGPASDFLATVALQPESRSRLLKRTRAMLNDNYPILRQWIDRQGGLFSLVEPRAGAIAYLRYNLDVDSIELVDRLRREQSVLIVPGGHFFMNNYLRIGFGSEAGYLREGLSRLESFLSGLK
ncbi:MAG TPA: aminotransferase class I/II-fold pyridoxal phosphate-dependent enzyme [Blastocatellia bacterium]|nr:aminotransferase class I/II-fold pyridoxal phosphate-dependent enzyme [Blastocatellia bacterium]